MILGATSEFDRSELATTSFDHSQVRRLRGARSPVMGRDSCVASLPFRAPEGLRSSDRLNVAEANMYPIPALLGASAPSFRPLPEGFGRFGDVLTPRFHRFSTSSDRSPTKLPIDGSPHCPYDRSRCGRSHRRCGVDLHFLSQPKPGKALKLRPRSYQLSVSPHRSVESQQAFRTRGRLPRQPSRNVVIAQDTQREVEAPSMKFVSFRRKQPR